MHETPVTVSAILDPAFGERIAALACDGPVWVTPSELNRAAVENYWKSREPNAHSVTYWSTPRTGDTEEEWLGILDDLELHHSRDWAGPGIARVRVVGAPLTTAAENALGEFGYSVVSTTPFGFVASRPIAAA
jgi:hypothetical protein